MKNGSERVMIATWSNMGDGSRKNRVRGLCVSPVGLHVGSQMGAKLEPNGDQNGDQNGDKL